VVAQSANPFTLRYCAALFAAQGRYGRALALMDAATASGPGNSLAWRALGMMIYAYSGDVEGAQCSLAKVKSPSLPLCHTSCLM
jgi:hypothetical protein